MYVGCRFNWCNLSISATFCHKLCSILLLIVPKYVLIITNLVVQFLPRTRISGQFERIPLRVFWLFHNLPEVFGDRLCMVLPLAGDQTQTRSKFEVSLNPFFGMTFHIAALRSDLFQPIFSFVSSFSSASLVFVNFLNSSVLYWTAWRWTFVFFVCTFNILHLLMALERRFLSAEFSTWSHVLFFSQHL